MKWIVGTAMVLLLIVWGTVRCSEALTKGQPTPLPTITTEVPVWA